MFVSSYKKKRKKIDPYEQVSDNGSNENKQSSDSDFANENERPSQQAKYRREQYQKLTQEQKDTKNSKRRERNQKLTQEQKDANNRKQRERNQKLTQEQKDAKNRKQRELAAAARAKKAMSPSTVPAARKRGPIPGKKRGPYNVSQKRAAIDIADEGHQIKKRKAPPKKRAAKKRAEKAAAKAEPKAGENTQAEPSVASPPLVDLLNIGTDDFSIIFLSLFNKMLPVELQKFCLKIVGLCDTYTMNDGKMYFELKPGHFFNSIEKNKCVFKALIDEYCPPLSALVAILESNGCLLNLYPLLLLGQLHMHADRKIQYPVDGVIERWCFNITDKKMQLQQQGNRENHVVFPCDHGNLVCMSDIARGIVEIADGVRLQHGCPKAVMEAVGSRASITIVMDLCFGSKAVKNTVLGLLCTDSDSIRSLREVAAATAPSVATRSSILLQDIDPNGILKDAIDTKAALLLSTCARYECNEKVEGK